MSSTRESTEAGHRAGAGDAAGRGRLDRLVRRRRAGPGSVRGGRPAPGRAGPVRERAQALLRGFLQRDAVAALSRRHLAAPVPPPGATVWVHDYQLQLAPRMLRERRDDVRIGFFNHIPFPGYEIFAQLPWRRPVVEGLLGADLLGVPRRADAT